MDKYTRKSFEHRKPWVEKRILELGDIFACGIYSWAVMSNHLHIVTHMSLRAGKVAGSYTLAVNTAAVGGNATLIACGA